jgi:hypothetical protein
MLPARKEMSRMKAIEMMLLALAAAFVVVTVPAVSYAVYGSGVTHIEQVIPAESQELEPGGGEMPHMMFEPSVFTNNAGQIEQLLPAESLELEPGGGETPIMVIDPSKFTHDAGRIEQLLPAED